MSFNATPPDYEPTVGSLGPDDLAPILAKLDPTVTICHFDRLTSTSQEAADAIGVELGQIAKSLCLTADGRPFVVVISGDKRIFEPKLARHFGVGRKKIRIVDAETCVRIFGYAPGGVPPVGHRTPGIPVLVDESLRRYTEIWTAAGSAQDNFRVTFEQLVTLTQGIVVDCSKEDAR